MPLKFAANISWMFTEIPNLEDRYKAAKESGFTGVECAWPYDVPLDRLAKAREQSGLEHVLINSWPGNLEAGDIGIGAVLSRQQEFKDKLELSIQYAKALNCKRLHVLASKKPHSFMDASMEEVYLENLAYAADRLQKEDITCLIEPINNKLSVPEYFLTTNEQAIEYIKQINHPNLKLQLDLFHAQIMTGYLTKTIQDCLPYTGHIQVSQIPGRNEPNSPGEVSYPYVFKLLESSGYEGWIGLEYKPKGDTVKGLSWMKEMAV